MLRSILIKGVLPFIVLAGALVVVYVVMTRERPTFEINVEPPSVLVRAATANREPVTFYVESHGSVAPRTRTPLTTEVSGKIIEVAPFFESGGFFRMGDVMIRIDSRNYATAVKSAQASVAQSKTQLATELAMTSVAEKDWERAQQLGSALEEYPELALRKPQLAEMQAKLDSAQAQLEKATGDLARTVIRAPYDGMVVRKLADLGQYVGTGSQIAETFSVDVAEVRLPITQNDLSFLSIPNGQDDDTVPTVLEASIGRALHTWDAEVVRSEGVFETSSLVMHVVAQVKDPYDLSGNGREALRIGTFVRARIQGNYAGELFVIPRDAIDEGTRLWIIDDNMQIQPRELSIVRSDREFSYVDNGIEDGDQYCITPIAQPIPGMRVRFRG